VAGDSSRPHRHRHSCLTIRLAVLLVIDLHLSWRAAAAVLALFAPWAAAAAPAFTTLRQWLLRLGLSLLRQAGHVVAGGWTLLIDHTVARGSCKCFVVLGIPTEDLPCRGYAPGHRDVTVLAVEAMDGSSGEKVAATLRRVLARVGAVTQVVSDAASELTDAVARVREDHPGLVWTYDVRHLLAALLRRRLEGCPRWGAFLAECGRLLPRLRQTAGNFLAPPALRVKARYMNLDSHVAWASRLLAWEQEGDGEALGQMLGQDADQARAWFADRFGWLSGYAADVKGWSELLEVASLALAEVHENGLGRQTAGRFWLRWQKRPGRRTFVGERMAREVKQGLSREGGKLAAGQQGLGSSDVIESLIGRYKEVVSRGPTGEATANVLLVPLMAGEPPSNEGIKAGLEAVSVEQGRAWIGEELGESNRAKKGRLFGELSPGRAVPRNGPKTA
jgi:hypothetical protein